MHKSQLETYGMLFLVFLPDAPTPQEKTHPKERLDTVQDHDNCWTLLRIMTTFGQYLDHANCWKMFRIVTTVGSTLFRIMTTVGHCLGS